MAYGRRYLSTHSRMAYERSRPGKFIGGLALIALTYVQPIGAALGWSGIAEPWSKAGPYRWGFLLPLLLGCYTIVYYRAAVRMPGMLAALVAIAAVVGFVLLLA